MQDPAVDIATRITLSPPDDWHVHLREGALLRRVVPHVSRRFRRAIVMPNLQPPVTTVERAAEYRREILAAVPPQLDFQPLMTLYLTEAMSPREIRAAHASEHVFAVKWYPAGATTHSEHGIRRIDGCYRVLETMQDCDLPLLVHPETADPDVDIFDREAIFLERELAPVIEAFPNLRVVVEHVTTREAVEFVRQASGRIGATITAHHLLLNRNALFQGGLRPHHYCLPVLKRERHRQALVEAAISGHPRFFLGTDSAPHPRGHKEAACGCAGIYTAHAAIELYAEVFETAQALDRLEGFASIFGPDFYRLPRNTGFMILIRQPWTVPTAFEIDGETIVPFRAGESLSWRIDSSSAVMQQ